ncbi:uncharacterized protein TNCV_3188201 [Trichonephila clavipes]|nr:uncharacterized protein TNCV_3188201 [Trichonephila clavipes]
MSVIAHQTEKEWISANEKSRQRMSQTQAEGAAKQHAARLEEAHLRAHLGRKPVSEETIVKVTLQVEVDPTSRLVQVLAVWPWIEVALWHWPEALDLPRSTVQKIMRNILRYYPYKLQPVQEVVPHDFKTRHMFSLQFLARLEVDLELPWNILWTDEVHFHLDGSVNTHNCRIWETDNPHSTLQVPLHSPKVTVWCGFFASFILGPYFFEELGDGGPVTCAITVQRYASLLRNKIICKHVSAFYV